jgi:hypothetical protein
MMLLDDDIEAVRLAMPKTPVRQSGNDSLFNDLLAKIQGQQQAAAPHQAAIERAMPGLSQPKGNVSQWIGQALQAMHLDNSFAPGIANMIQHESGGNPNSVNNYDSNAKAGHTSRGLMQTIPSTFAAHMLPGHGNIDNPVDNIIAGVRYAQGRYGDQMIKNGGRYKAGKYIGY